MKLMIEPSLTSLEVNIREKYQAMSSAHVSLCVDLLNLMKVATSRNRTYVDALELVNLVERSIKLVEKK